MWFVWPISAFRPLFSAKRRSVPKLFWVKNSLITFSEHDIGALKLLETVNWRYSVKTVFLETKNVKFTESRVSLL